MAASRELPDYWMNDDMTEHIPTPHPYKLRSIELKDFKSISHAKIDFHPLTVVVGANSSGKSSLIQSMLALSQMVRSGAVAEEFPLNGELTRLGTFGELKNFKSDNADSPVEITVRLLFDESDRPMAFPSPGYTVRDTWALRISPYNDDIGCARIDSVRLQTDLILDGNVETLLTYDVSDIKAAAHIYDRSNRNDGPSFFVLATGNLADSKSGELYNLDAIELGDGLPGEGYSRSERINAYAQKVWDYMFSILRDSIAKMDDTYTKEISPARSADAVEYAVERIQDLINHPNADFRSRINSSPIITSYDLGTIWSTFQSQLLNFWPMLRTDLKKDEKIQDLGANIAQSMKQLGERNFCEQLRKYFESEPWSTEEIVVVVGEHLIGGNEECLISSCRGCIYNFFGRSVRYLGPLRANPQPLHDPGPNRPDIGVNGEYAAAVIHARANQQVLLPEINGLLQYTNLSSALNYWLQQFGIADLSHTEDRGRFGLDLRISPPSMGRPVDLTSVGVGVSQVLPVILLCLLAEPGDLVILEQPELHLHPALQQKLADFLLECTRSGRQILVETHSEHLINRLRRRVAEDDSDETESLVGLLFAEQHDGQTIFYESKINAYGGLSQDWPDGFLDLGAREAQSLVRSSVYKHRRRQNRDEPLSDERKNGAEQ